jgi:hypothetical protein
MTAAQRKARNVKRTSASTFYACAVATLAANVYASNHTVVGVLTGLWGPLALFLSLELLERVPCKGREGMARKVGVGLLAFVAGWTSYWHLVHVFTEGGADTLSRYLLPLTVDVLMAISRAAMVSRPSSTRRAPARKAASVRRLKVA